VFTQSIRTNRPSYQTVADCNEHSENSPFKIIFSYHSTAYNYSKRNGVIAQSNKPAHQGSFLKKKQKMKERDNYRKAVEDGR
jgi:hypothetical protein